MTGCNQTPACVPGRIWGGMGRLYSTCPCGLRERWSRRRGRAGGNGAICDATLRLRAFCAGARCLVPCARLPFGRARSLFGHARSSDSLAQPLFSPARSLFSPARSSFSPVRSSRGAVHPLCAAARALFRGAQGLSLGQRASKLGRRSPSRWIAGLFSMLFRTRYSCGRAASPMHVNGGLSPPYSRSALALPLRLRASA